MREIIEKLETEIEDPAVPVLKKSEDQMNFKGSESILHAIKSCWDKDTFIFELTHNFLHLSIQILKRLKVWLFQILEIKSTQLRTSKKGSKYLDENDNYSNLIDIVKIRNDIFTLQRHINNMTFVDLELTEEMHNIIVISLKKALQEIIDKMNENTKPLIISEFYESCSGILIPNVKTISNTYRFTQKAEPTEASDYVKKLFEPINCVFSKKELYISEEEKNEWTSPVFEDLSLLFSQQAKQLINSIKKTQDFLDRKQKKSEQNQGVSDTQKMYMQLIFDIREFENQLKAYNFDTENSENFQKLKNIINEAKKWIK